MLLAVEGGGFFSSSASGYSKGLTLLLLGQKNEEKPIRVAPWSQYQLVDQGTNPDIQLASGKNRSVRGCASYVCFGRSATGLESPSPLKVGPTQHQEVSVDVPVPVPDEDKNQICSPDHVADETSIPKTDIKSSLKKPKNGIPVSASSKDEREELCQKGSDAGAQMERRTVQWTDISGGELVEIREFEPSDDGGSDDDEFHSGSGKTCSCTIM